MKLKVAIFGAFVLIVATLFVCFQGYLIVGEPPLYRKSDVQIEQYLLRMAPIGSSSDQVLHVIHTDLKMPSAQYRTHFYTPGSDSPYTLQHVDGRIGVLLGTITHGFSLVGTDVSVQWDFDSDNTLRNITVLRQVTGP